MCPTPDRAERDRTGRPELSGSRDPFEAVSDTRTGLRGTGPACLRGHGCEGRVVQGDPVAPEGPAGREQAVAERAGELVDRAPARGRDLVGVVRRELVVL